MILDIDQYTDMGGTIKDEILFDRLQYRAESLINRITHNRIKDESPARESVRRLAFELISLLESAAESGAAANSVGVASVSNDGVSVSYLQGAQAVAAEDAQVQALAALYLAGETTADGVCLLYAGRMY